MTALICIIDDDDSFRTAIARLLQLRGYDVTQFATADDFLVEVRKGIEPDCVLLDISLPGLSGPALQERLVELGCSFPIIFVTGFGDVPTTVRAIKAGAEDVLTKPVSEQALMDGIKSALAHLHRDRSNREWRRGAHALLETLTPREREVFECVVRGKSNKQAGRELGITERTIKAHRQRIFEKLHARTVADLVSLAERLDLLSHQRIADTDTRPVSID
jgi:RNA polymerase sigma factor (sigma-70 family)